MYRPEEANLDGVRVVNQARNKGMEALQRKGVSTRPATHAVHMLSYYRKKYELLPNDFPNAFVANDCSISLPLFNGMTEIEQDYVIEQVLGILN